MFLPCRVPTIKGQKVVKHGGHKGISFFLIQSAILWQPNCDLRIVRTTAYLKAVMEVYENSFTGLGRKEESQPVLLDILAAMNMAWYMYIFLIICSDFSSSYNDFNLKSHPFKTKKSLRLQTKSLVSGYGVMVGSVCTSYWAVKHVS